MEIVVDANGPEEQAMGWYYYLADTMNFPFAARCVARRTISPLEPGDKVEVVEIAPAEDCEHGRERTLIQSYFPCKRSIQR